MKKLELTTGKGEFIIEDAVDRDNYLDTVRATNPDAKFIGVVKDLTEEQASEIVDKSWDSGIKITTRYPNYETKDWSYYGSFGYAIKSLHSLIKSKGWYLENPFEKFADECGCEEAESRTLHNPVIFKIK